MLFPTQSGNNTLTCIIVSICRTGFRLNLEIKDSLKKMAEEKKHKPGQNNMQILTYRKT